MNTPSNPILLAQQVTKHYDIGGMWTRKRTVEVLRGVSLSVAEGEVLGLVGESGCGKSTLARQMLGTETPSSGEILVGGRPIHSYNRRERARLIQPVFQDPYSSLNPRMRVGDIIMAPLEVQAMGNRQSRLDQARELMASVGLPPHLFQAYPGQLSGGQRQRVAIARALSIGPKILICDEPTSALDVSVQAQVLNLISTLKRQLNLTIVIISHDLAVVNHLANHVAVMYDGNIVEYGPTDAIFKAPQHAYTQTLLGAVLAPAMG